MFGCRNLGEPACRERAREPDLSAFLLGFQLLQRKYVQTHQPAANQLRSRRGGCCPSGKCCLFPPGPQGSPGRGWRHGAALVFRWRPQFRAAGSSPAELSQHPEAARGWRHPGVQGGPRGHTWGRRGDNLHGACPGVPQRGMAGTSEGRELPALLLLLAGSRRALGLGLGTRADLTAHVPPRLGHLLSRTETPPVQEGWCPGAAPPPPSVVVHADAEHHTRGFSHLRAEMLEGNVV